MDYLQMAKQIALETGKFILKRRNVGFTTETKSSALDIVTQVDHEAEKYIHEKIKEAAPDHQFLGEEESFERDGALACRLEKAKSEPYLWIVDPIDGTNNFVEGMSGYTVSIALACYGEVTVGAIYDPVQDQLFYAEKGKGAFMNGERISVSRVNGLEESMIATGFPTDPSARAMVLSGLQEVGRHCRTIRSLGSAALHLAYVASGKMAAYWENGLHAWDMAAGVIIVQEAGGRITDTRGETYSLSTTDLLASNGHIHQELLSVINIAQ